MNQSPRAFLAGAFCCFGWISSYTYSLHLIGPHLHPCTNGDAFPYLAGMVAGPLTLLFAALMLTVGSVLGVTLRWPGLLHLFTLGVVIFLLPDYLASTTVDGRFICTSNAAGGPVEFDTTLWQRAFVPVQNAAVVAFTGFLVWYWLRAAAVGVRSGRQA